MNSMVLSFALVEILTALRGMKRGLYGVIYGVITWVVIVSLIPVMAPKIMNILEKNPSLHDKVYDTISPYVEVLAMNDFSGDISDESMDAGLLQQYIQNFIGSEEQLEQYEKMVLGEAEQDGSGLPADGTSGYYGGSAASKEKAAEMTETYTRFIIYAIAMCIGYIMLKFLLSIAGIVIKGTMNSRDRSSLDSLGLLWGLVEGVLYMFITMTMVSLIAPTSIGTMMMRWISQSRVLQYLYDVNIFKNLIVF